MSILLACSDGCSVYQFRNETGDGTMTCYDIFPGARLCFNDFHIQYFDSDYNPRRKVFAIDHCREGKMEYMAGKNAYSYMGAGDIKFDTRQEHKGRFSFPSGHFHGLTVMFDMEVAATALPDEIKDFPVQLDEIQEKYCQSRYPNVISRMDAAKHIFHALYQVPQEIRIPYFRIKVMELLLCLAAFELPKQNTEKPYYYKTQVEKVKAIQSFLQENISENYTQEELSEQFEISLSAMKSCFKAVYGTTLGAWVADCRMNMAAELLYQDKRKSVAEIAGLVGYDSASKFAIAFRKRMKMSPTEYRSAIRTGGKL